MRYIKEYKEIDWDNDEFDIEEKEPSIYLSIDEITPTESYYIIMVTEIDLDIFKKLLHDNGYVWFAGQNIYDYPFGSINNNSMYSIIVSKEKKLGMSDYYNNGGYVVKNFRKKNEII